MALVPTCSGVLSVGGGGEIICSVGWTQVDEAALTATTWTLDQVGAAEIAGAAAIIFAIAWGLRLAVRNIFNLR